MSEVTQILAAIDSGDPSAAEQLLPLVYDELRRLAAAKLAHEQPGQTLQATALVHEAYLRLVKPGVGGRESGVGGRGSGVGSQELGVGGKMRLPTPDSRPPIPIAFDSRGHFFAAAAEAMRRILVENARRRRAQKRGGDLERIALEPALLPAADREERLLELEEALVRFEQQQPQKAQLVKLRFYAGLTNEQAAAALGISSATADRHWAYARAWLQRAMAADSPVQDSCQKSPLR